MYAVHLAEVSPELAPFLDLGGYAWKPVAGVDDVASGAPPEGWSGAIVRLDDGSGRGTDAAWNVVRALRESVIPTSPLLLLIRGNALDELTMRGELFDDFCLDPFHPRELDARLAHLNAGRGGDSSEIIEYGPLRINLDTYEAVVDSNPLDLTYMEYELLRFLASQPGRVFTREALLNQVWGYEYYGGARTVDVHIRRLRAKLGEENANLIQTVRSVGYRLGTYRWR